MLELTVGELLGEVPTQVSTTEKTPELLQTLRP